MTSIAHSRSAKFLALTAALLAAGCVTFFSAAAPANADTPAPQATTFNAPQCVGSTVDDPTQASGPVADLTSVFGQRLTDYNAGKVVVLYDSYGDNDNDGYPALCGTRYVSGVGAVSEWMFCTDIFSHICSGTDANGALLDINGNVIPGMAPQAGNPKLDADQKKLIAWLIQNGHSYQGTGYYDFGTTTAVENGTTLQRNSLQTLVWCISDPVDPATTDPTELQRAETCADSMSPTEQARLLQQIPTTPTIALSLTNSSTALAVGGTAHIGLTTNLYNQPITITTPGIAGTLSVLSGSATYDPTTNSLTVAGTDPSTSTTVTLGFTASAAGQAIVTAVAHPISTNALTWNQSPGVANDGIPCQVFSTFSAVDLPAVTGTADATFATATSPTDGTSATATGPSVNTGGVVATSHQVTWLPLLALFASALLAGAALTVAALRRRSTNP